jgi:menaquinone-9 beta-reductase
LGETVNAIFDTTWDVAIIGAGPAGGVAAALLSQRGRRVLLIERSAWPREKVCGGCLNAAAVEFLHEAGLGSALSGSQPLRRVAWHVGRQSVELPAPGGAAILRSEMDAAIVATAVERGCTFLPGVSATLLPGCNDDVHRFISLKDADGSVTIRAGAVLACDGIAGASLTAEPWAKWRIKPGAWIGVSTTCHHWPTEIRTGTIHMHVGRGGYVGLVRLSDGRTHLAAALDPAACKSTGGPAPLIEKIFGSCGQESSLSSRFRGTGELTRRREHLGGYRVLAVGDACGYVEPFTGEGMSWAIASAREAVEILPPAGAGWPASLADEWQSRHRATIARAQRICRTLRPMMHHPALVAAAVSLGRAIPAVGSFIAGRVGAAPLTQNGVQ